MPLPVPNLDDRQFEQLAAEARALIPRNLPSWTDYNSSDPGITLLELFAFLAEAAIYQINRVPPRTLQRFAKIVNVTQGENEPIEQTMRRAVEALRVKSRAITEQDFEVLAKQAAPDVIARVKTVVEDARNQIKVVIVPNQPQDPKPTPTSVLRQTVFTFLRRHSPITTRLRVVKPDYNPPISIDVEVVPDNSLLNKSSVELAVGNAIRNFLSPLTGGADGKGWEFGRAVFRSELYRVIESLAAVDHVRRLRLNESESVNKIAMDSPLSLVDLRALKVTVLDS